MELTPEAVAGAIVVGAILLLVGFSVFFKGNVQF